MNKTTRDELVDDFMIWYKNQIQSIRDELIQNMPNEEISSINGHASTELVLKSITKISNKLNSWDTYEKVVDNIPAFDNKKMAELINKIIDPRKNIIEKGIIYGLISGSLNAVKNVLSLIDELILKIGRDTLFDKNSYNDVLYITTRKIEFWLPKLKLMFNDEFKDFKSDITKELNNISNNQNLDETIEDWKFICFFIENKLPSFYLSRKLKSDIIDNSDSISDEEFEKELDNIEKLFSETNMEVLKNITVDCNKLSPLFSYISVVIDGYKKS